MSSPGPKGQPQFVGGDAVSLAAYLSNLGNYSALVGNTIVGTSAQRNAFNSVYGFAPYEGLTFIETDTDNTYRIKANGWRGTKTEAGNVAMDTNPTSVNSGYAWTKSVSFTAGRFTVAPVVALGVYTSASQDQHAGVVDVTANGFTLYFWRANNVTTTIGWSATPQD